MNGLLPTTAVCVVDDDQSVLTAVGRLLRAEGFEVAKFGDPTVFLTAIEQSSPRVALLDVAMPVMSGLEVQAILRQKSPETRVVFCSGQSDAAIREAALRNGAIDFLEKPFDDEELVMTVRRALNGVA